MGLLEAFGCPFGACQNAYTSVDETVYELDVPTDEDMKPMEEALDMIAQFAHAIRCAAAIEGINLCTRQCVGAASDSCR